MAAVDLGLPPVHPRTVAGVRGRVARARSARLWRWAGEASLKGVVCTLGHDEGEVCESVFEGF